jgi:hypothetical protein
VPSTTRAIRQGMGARLRQPVARRSATCLVCLPPGPPARRSNSSNLS